MKAFAYVNPTNEKEAVAALKIDGIAHAARRRPGPARADEGLHRLARPHRQREERARRDDHGDARRRHEDRRGGEDRRSRRARAGRAGSIRRSSPRRSRSARRRSAIRAPSAATSTSGRAAGTSATKSSSASRRAARAASRSNGENQYHAIFGNDGPSHIVHPSSLAVPFVAYGAKFRVVGPNGEREIAGRRLLHAADAAERAEGERARRRGDPDARDPAGAGQRQERALRSALQGSRTTGRSRSRPSC